MKRTHLTLAVLIASMDRMQATANSHRPFKSKHDPDAGFSFICWRTFSIGPETGIFLEGESAALINVGQYLAERLRPATGFGLVVAAAKEGAPSGIYLSASGNDTELGDEGYEISITKDSLRVHANKPSGVFRAIQTIRQLLPAEIERAEVQKGPWEIATGKIRDYPTYGYRGSMFDLGRHFFGVDDIKRYIDLIAAYKLNVLHLGLSNDQGWRIEIKSWPNLTVHGAAPR